jgi:hypothetical protein
MDYETVGDRGCLPYSGGQGPLSGQAVLIVKKTFLSSHDFDRMGGGLK